jgi:hypothetical protein
MVKSIRVTYQADSISQLRTRSVSEKARKQLEQIDAVVAQRAAYNATNERQLKRSDSHSRIEAVQLSGGRVQDHLRNKTVRLDSNFFGEVLEHLASMPSDGTFIPSRRHILSSIMHSKIEQGAYSSSKHSASLSWQDVDSLLSDLSRLRMMSVSSPIMDCAESDLEDMCTRIMDLSRKVNLAQALSKCGAAEQLWTVRVVGDAEGYDTEEAELMRRLKGVDGCVASKQVQSFSSAPIWYQQAMENGPPEDYPRGNGEAFEVVNKAYRFKLS